MNIVSILILGGSAAIACPVLADSEFVLQGWRTGGGANIALDGTLFDLNGVDTLARAVTDEVVPGSSQLLSLDIPHDTCLLFGDGPVQVTPFAPYGPLGTIANESAFWPAAAIGVSIGADGRSLGIDGVTTDPRARDATGATALPSRTSQPLPLFNNLEALYLGRISVRTAGQETGAISGTIELMFSHENAPLTHDPRRRVSAPIDSTIELNGAEFQVISIPTAGSYPAPFPPFTTMLNLTVNDLYVVRTQ